MTRFLNPGPLMTALLKRAGSLDPQVAAAGLRGLAKALEVPLNQGVMAGDIWSDLFTVEKFQPGVPVEYPIDLLVPGTELDYSAFAIPAQGRLPEKTVEGDYTVVNVFDVGASIDFPLRYAEDARWPVLGRVLEILEGMFVRKYNTDAWRLMISAAYYRFLNVFDNLAPPGFFSKRLVELGKNIMRRFAGGNSTSLNRGKLKRLYVSPESLGDIRGWSVYDGRQSVDPWTMRDIHISDDLDAINIFGVEVRSLDELGIGQEFQKYYTDVLGASMPTYTRNNASETKLELAIGVDTSRPGSFLRPEVKPIELFEDPTYHRQRRASFYGWSRGGWFLPDNRRVLALSI